MGKLEKLIVLAVLFGAAVVLALSLNREKDVEAASPLAELGDLSSELYGDAPVTPSSPAEVPDPYAAMSGKAPSLLLNAGAEAQPDVAPAPTAALALEPRNDPSRPILVGQHDLRPSFLDEYRLYTVIEGDTWAGLAQRFYQDGRYTRNLHLANEDLGELTPGTDILVPVYDLLAVEAGLQPSDASAAPSAMPSDSPSAFLAAPAAVTAPAERAASKPAGTSTARGGELEYEVRPGDTLSEIALAALGGASRWKEILELNRGLLAKPEDLRVGMKLALPAGAKLPSSKPAAKPSVVKAEKKAEPKPAASSSTATKKKKVL